MKRLCVALLIVVSFGCASNPAVPKGVPLRQEVVVAIDILDAVAKGVMAAADAKPPLITVAQANDVLNGIKASIRVLHVTGSCAHTVLTTALTQIDQRSFADQIRGPLNTARATIANGFWQVCVTSERPSITDGPTARSVTPHGAF